MDFRMNFKIPVQLTLRNALCALVRSSHKHTTNPSSPY